MAVERCGAGEQDEELQFELGTQDLLFQKCLRGRLEREARRKRELKEKEEADERKRKAALEHAFENEVDRLLEYFEEGFSIETADAYGSTLLSEAAAGGAEDCIQVLLGSGADPNSIGRNKRTPLWRAANAGFASALQLLLRGGGDPRIPDEGGVMPYSIANGAEVRMLLECWDIATTASIRQSIATSKQKMEKERAEKEKKQTRELKEALEAAERKAAVAKVEVARVRRLAADYRQQQVGHAQKGEVARMQEVAALLQRAEDKLESAKRIHQDLDWQVKRARLKLRDFEGKLRRRRRKEGEAVVEPERVIPLRDLVDVVTKDVGGRRKEDGRWPLVFDATDKAATFFRYSGAAFFDIADLAVLTVSDVLEERQRLLLALLKHLKYGGMVVVSLGDDLAKMSVAEEAFDSVQCGFFKTFLDRSVLYSYLLPRRFLALVPPESADDYSELMFEDELLTKFVLVFVVGAVAPAPEVLEKECSAFYTVIVRDPEDEAAAELEQEVTEVH